VCKPKKVEERGEAGGNKKKTMEGRGKKGRQAQGRNSVVLHSNILEERGVDKNLAGLHERTRSGSRVTEKENSGHLKANQEVIVMG